MSRVVIIYRQMMDGTNRYRLLELLHETPEFPDHLKNDVAKELEPAWSDEQFFSSLEMLNRFAFNYCEELDADAISMVTNEQYNQVMFDQVELSQVFNNLYSVGNIIENIDKAEGKSFFGIKF